jgi:hypothetical protein
MAAGAGAVWVTSVPGDSVMRIDPGTGTVTQTLPLGGARAAALAFGIGRLWVADLTDNSLLELDPRSGAVLRSVTLHLRPTALAIGARALWVADYGLYGYLWTAYKDRFQAAMKPLGLDIGFLYQKDAAFEKRAAELVADRPELSDLVDLMRRDRQEFQKALASYRNTHLEHRTGDPDPRVASFHRLDSAETMFPRRSIRGTPLSASSRSSTCSMTVFWSPSSDC